MVIDHAAPKTQDPCFKGFDSVKTRKKINEQGHNQKVLSPGQEMTPKAPYLLFPVLFFHHRGFLCLSEKMAFSPSVNNLKSSESEDITIVVFSSRNFRYASKVRSSL